MLPVVLLVDDDDSFRCLVQAAFKHAGLRASLECAEDGEQAIRYLSREGKYADDSLFPFPTVVLLDLKMPRYDGFEVLIWKRTQPQLQSLPFVVFSSSDLEIDHARASELGASAYLVKPMEFSELRDMVKDLDRCWSK